MDVKKPCETCVFAIRVDGAVVKCGHPSNQVIMLGGKRVAAHVQAANPNGDCQYHEKVWLNGRFFLILAAITVIFLSEAFHWMYPDLSGFWAALLGLVGAVSILLVTAVLTSLKVERKSS